MRFPPGRARLVTNPAATGSAAVKTIGIVPVADLAASAVADPPVATIRSTGRRTSSAARSRSRSGLKPAHRYSTVMFAPST